MEGHADTDEDKDGGETGGEQDRGDNTEPKHTMSNTPKSNTP